ncbi:hypothetical protein HDU97_006145 [Phlyctochytrium planicorne]|nr:hypothetical protein HDU97_006145 [Phlyctochytrium planicorne]
MDDGGKIPGAGRREIWLWKDPAGVVGSEIFGNKRVQLGRLERIDDMLQVSYPALFEDAKSNNVGLTKESSSSNESATILVTVIMTILTDLLPLMRQKVIICLDDAQEYNSTLRQYYDRFTAFQYCNVILVNGLSCLATESLALLEMKSYGLNIDGISTLLLEDINEKSQGNPMVIKLICRFLSTSNYVVVKDRLLLRNVLEKETITLPIDASAAVVATLDKLPSNAQMLLRLASVAGQFFTVSEVSFCLKALSFDLSSVQILDLFQLAKEQGILSLRDSSETGNDFSFHHYLIYQGIYESILTSRREYLHQIYASHYEQLYEATFSQLYLPALLHHLLKFPEHEDKKIKYVRIAFYTFADWNRPIEAEMYYDILVKLEARNGGARMTNLEMARELRHIAAAKADASKMIDCDPKKKRNIALKTLLKLFPTGFSRSLTLEYVKDDPRGDQLAKYQAIFDVLEEIVWLSICTIALLITTETGLELGIVEFLFYFAQAAGTNVSPNDLASVNTAAGAIMVALGRVRSSRKLYQEAEALFDLANVDISRQGVSSCWSCAFLMFASGELEKAKHAAILCIDVLEKGFRSPVPITHVMRVLGMVSGTFFEENEVEMNAISEQIDGPYVDHPELFADMKLFMAYHLFCVGRFEEAYKIYNEFFLSVQMEKTPQSIRIFSIVAITCHLEIAQLAGVGCRLDAKAQEELFERLIRSSEFLCMMAKLQQTLQSLLFPPALMFTLTWLDYVLLSKSGTIKIPVRVETSFKKLCVAQFTTCRPELRAFNSIKLIDAVKRDMGRLHRKISKSNVMRLIATTSLLDGGGKFGAVLTEIFRARVAVRIVKLAHLMGGKDGGKVLELLKDVAGGYLQTLVMAGHCYEAGSLQQLLLQEAI